MLLSVAGWFKLGVPPKIPSRGRAIVSPAHFVAPRRAWVPIPYDARYSISAGLYVWVLAACGLACLVHAFPGTCAHFTRRSVSPSGLCRSRGFGSVASPVGYARCLRCEHKPRLARCQWRNGHLRAVSYTLIRGWVGNRAGQWRNRRALQKWRFNPGRLHPVNWGHASRGISGTWALVPKTAGA